MNINDMLIQGAIDFHVHTAPDICPRKYTDIQLAEECRKAGMSGFVSKCHQGDTSARASAVSELFPDLKVFGGIVLNHVVGGLNEEAVYACRKMGGKIVWFPTVDAYNDADYKRLHFVDHLGGDSCKFKQAGAEHIVLSTDLGQKKSPDPAEGMRSFVRKLYKSDISEEEIRQMTVANPRELLGI